MTTILPPPQRRPARAAFSVMADAKVERLEQRLPLAPVRAHPHAAVGRTQAGRIDD